MTQQPVSGAFWVAEVVWWEKRELYNGRAHRSSEGPIPFHLGPPKNHQAEQSPQPGARGRVCVTGDPPVLLVAVDVTSAKS